MKLYANIDEYNLISADLKMAILQDALDKKITNIKYDVYILDDAVPCVTQRCGF